MQQIIQLYLCNRRKNGTDQDERGRIEYALEEGKKIGIGEGRRGGEVEIARELKKNGVNIDLIVTSTGLPKEEIENL